MYESLREIQKAQEAETHDPGISVVSGDCLRMDGSSCLGGSVAMVLEKIVSERDLLSCHTHLPQLLFEQGQEFFPAEGEEEDHTSHSAEMTTPLLSSIFQDSRSEIGDGEEEMEVEGEGEGEEGMSGGRSVPHITGTGLNVFIQSHGTGNLNTGPLDLHPELSIGRLLDPVDSAAVISHDQPTTETVMNRPICRSLSSYLDICRRHLGFSERETEHAQKLYRKIEEGGEVGVEEVWLEESCHDSAPASGRSHQDYIEAFVNFEMVRTQCTVMYYSWVQKPNAGMLGSGSSFVAMFGIKNPQSCKLRVTIPPSVNFSDMQQTQDPSYPTHSYLGSVDF